MNTLKIENKEDDLVQRFFEKNKSEISDNGFSEKVMKQLPAQKSLDWIVWFFAATGISVTLYIFLSMEIVIPLPTINDTKTLLYIIGGVFTLPVLMFPVLKTACANCFDYSKFSKFLSPF
jgi:hypothetical protein